MVDSSSSDTVDRFDVVIVGAGFGGIHTLYRFRQAGLRVVLIEEADGVGGTWNWNRYPGCRVDFESLEYSLNIPEVQDEWEWSQRYAGQPELLRYHNFAVDRLQLRSDMRFEQRLASAEYDSVLSEWKLAITDVTNPASPPTVLNAHHLVLATGFLSTPVWPRIDGLDQFAGTLLHTAAWPEDAVEFAGKRVGVIGTGSSGVQMVQTLADKVAHLSVFQRTAAWPYPLTDEPMDPEYQAWVKANYPEIRKAETETLGSGRVLFANAIEPPPSTATSDVSKEEVFAEWERRWLIGGPGTINRSYSDLIVSEYGNELAREFLTQKIMQTVDDPATARKLVPNYHPLTRRPTGQQNYLTAFNRDNVELVDVAEDPIDRVTPEGVVLASGRLVSLDILICATGFDAGSGAALRIDIRGKDDVSLRDHWEDGVRTFLGLMVNGFPNMYLINGPQSPGPHFNPAILCGVQAQMLLDLLATADSEQAVAIEASRDAEESWSALCEELYAATLIIKTNSWWLGTNIPGKPRRAVGYRGGVPNYLAAFRAALEDGSLRFVPDEASVAHSGQSTAI